MEFIFEPLQIFDIVKVVGSSITKKEKAVALRKEGWSYNKIIRELNLTSKGTLSYWFKNLRLDTVSKKKLAENTKKAHARGLFEANKRRAKQVGKENTKAYERGINYVKSRKEIDQFTKTLLVGALYWGEGTKYYNPKSPALELANADYKMIRIYLSFIKNVLAVPEEKIKFKVFIHDQTSSQKAVRYWSSCLKISSKRIKLVNAVSRASRRKRPKRALPFGTMSVKINDRGMYHYVKGLIEGIKQTYK